MAGSYRHVTSADGEFIGTRLLDGGRDAYETLEEMWMMIDWLTGGDKQKIFEAWREGYFKKECPPENFPMATFERFWRKD